MIFEEKQATGRGFWMGLLCLVVMSLTTTSLRADNLAGHIRRTSFEAHQGITVFEQYLRINKLSNNGAVAVQFNRNGKQQKVTELVIEGNRLNDLVENVSAAYVMFQFSADGVGKIRYSMWGANQWRSRFTLTDDNFLPMNHSPARGQEGALFESGYVRSVWTEWAPEIGHTYKVVVKSRRAGKSTWWGVSVLDLNTSEVIDMGEFRAPYNNQKTIRSVTSWLEVFGLPLNDDCPGVIDVWFSDVRYKRLGINGWRWNQKINGTKNQGCNGVVGFEESSSGFFPGDVIYLCPPRIPARLNNRCVMR